MTREEASEIAEMAESPRGIPLGSPSGSSQINRGAPDIEPDQITHEILPHITPSSTIRPENLDEGIANYLATPSTSDEIP